MKINFKRAFWHNLLMDKIEIVLIDLSNYVWNQRKKFK